MKLKHYLLICLCLLSGIKALAYDAYVNGIYYNFSGNEAEVTSGNNKYSGTVVIPKYITYDGTIYGVTSIGRAAFYRCDGLTSITIPNSVTSIDVSAFYICGGLTSITIPNSVTSIGDWAFYNCYALTSITIPNSVTSIGREAFYGCNVLTSVTIGNSVTNIGDYAFKSCFRLASIKVEAGNTTYDSRNNCNAIIETATNTLVVGCKTTVIPGSVTSIGNYAFNGCNLISVTIPNSVTSIGNWAFSSCSSLTSITIPNSVTSIGDYAFWYSRSLTSITIPNSVTSIGGSAFEGTPWYDNQPYGLVYAGMVAYKYKGTMPEGTEITLEDGTLGIAGAAFDGCSGLTSITIPNNVTSIGSSAFNRCTGLTSITFPSRLTSIGSSAFFYCYGLTSVTIPNSVTSIGDSAFSYCSSLTSVTIPNSVTSIGNAAFQGCSGLTKVIVQDIAAWCRISFETPDSNPLFQARHLYSDEETEITDLFIPEEVTNIGNYAFSHCSGLASITIPNSMTSIGDNAFYGCYARLYVNRGTDGLLSVWNYGLTPYETGTDITLPYPYASVTSRTQTTIKYKINNIYPDLEYNFEYSEVVGENEYVIKGLRPEYQLSIYLTVNSANNTYNTSKSTTTLPISPTVVSKDITASSISVEVSCIAGDANVISKSIVLNGEETNGSGTELTLKGLDPNKSYNFEYKMIVEDDNGATYTYIDSKDISTADLTLTALQPKVISDGNVILAAQSNLDDEETNVGFEWRRIDWTDDFDSKSGGAYLFEGMMEGYIRSVNSNYLWKFRPFYTSNAGNTYYGEWKGMDPSDYSYFEPTVHTYADINVTGNSAEVKGYAMRGTDNVTSQGFMYWENNSSFSLRRRVTNIPDNVTVVRASGNVMTATLEDLEYETSYSYVAFMTTSEGETFYGEVNTFTTDVDPDGVDEVKSQDAVTEIARYDVQGRPISKPQKGINIIRYSDGSTRKVMVK